MVAKAGCYIVALLLITSECLAAPPFSERSQKPVLSPYLFLDPTFNCPYWRWMQPEDYTDNRPRNPTPRTNQARSDERPSTGTGIRPTGHKTYFMRIPVGNIPN